MIRWLALLTLLALCSGCMVFDDLMYGEPPPGWTAPPGGCSAPPANVNTSQTAEPELLK